MSDNNTGYEIRADVLSMAQSILIENLQRKNDAIYLHNDNFPNDKKPLVTTTIGAQDVIAVATELNEFVNSK